MARVELLARKRTPSTAGWEEALASGAEVGASGGEWGTDEGIIGVREVALGELLVSLPNGAPRHYQDSLARLISGQMPAQFPLNPCETATAARPAPHD